MHRNRFLTCLCNLLLISWLLGACAAPEDARPDNLMPETQMANILTEIHLIEARVSRMGLGSSDSSNIVYKRMENQVFKKMKVDTSTYTKSYIYYSSHPRQMETIYKQIIDNLKKKVDDQQKQIHTKKQAPTKKPARS
ncbi:DUF4296 domain-containing protein [Spirosoma utsteinense]|uniref:DUF4296 domain-containing protein n=1 Tax=Spirosoma utsteinense TaxID=2585773 RepID=A0ABR6WBD3_9BACT|nr:DUF4296 domain-containing protein [Spirosoma utsteinense]MBC3783842.1 hypothetical protein [Spirosoma utsteinense]MBC3793579.1 hypothetical protein [Spirosoma utsteinense]